MQFKGFREEDAVGIGGGGDGVLIHSKIQSTAVGCIQEDDMEKQQCI